MNDFCVYIIAGYDDYCKCMISLRSLFFNFDSCSLLVIPWIVHYDIHGPKVIVNVSSWRQLAYLPTFLHQIVDSNLLHLTDCLRYRKVRWAASHVCVLDIKTISWEWMYHLLQYLQLKNHTKSSISSPPFLIETLKLKEYLESIK